MIPMDKMDPKKAVLEEIMKEMSKIAGSKMMSKKSGGEEPKALMLEIEKKESPSEEAAESPQEEAMEEKMGIDEDEGEDRDPMHNDSPMSKSGGMKAKMAMDNSRKELPLEDAADAPALQVSDEDRLVNSLLKKGLMPEMSNADASLDPRKRMMKR